ncbi:hypothetical protein KAU37_05110 [Candidatus Bipolaricaulota bacterium]|nr:hypothetical protein [Candidatus Bipolaricaulota bacterium]
MPHNLYAFFSVAEVTCASSEPVDIRLDPDHRLPAEGGRSYRFPARTPASPLAITIEPIIETALFPSFALGMEIELRHATLFGGYHLRRGWLVGIGILLR